MQMQLFLPARQWLSLKNIRHTLHQSVLFGHRYLLGV